MTFRLMNSFLSLAHDWTPFLSDAGHVVTELPQIERWPSAGCTYFDVFFASTAPFSSARAPLRTPRIPYLPSWHAYSRIGPGVRVREISTVQGCAKVSGSSTVNWYSSVSASTRRKRSVSVMFGPEPRNEFFTEKFVVSTTSVSPCQ